MTENRSNFSISLEIGESFFETCATGTLIGTILKKTDGTWPKSVVLVFSQTSLAWRRQNKGPRHYVMCEYTPMCFVQDVLDLIRRGIDVTVEETVRDPE